jgi:hypothetical protein
MTGINPESLWYLATRIILVRGQIYYIGDQILETFFFTKN